eukprot:4700470-Pyramimonas_sp.AAC.1
MAQIAPCRRQHKPWAASAANPRGRGHCLRGFPTEEVRGGADCRPRRLTNMATNARSSSSTDAPASSRRIQPHTKTQLQRRHLFSSSSPQTTK